MLVIVTDVPNEYGRIIIERLAYCTVAAGYNDIPYRDTGYYFYVSVTLNAGFYLNGLCGIVYDNKYERNKAIFVRSV